MSTIFHVDVNSAFLSWSALKLLREDPGGVDLRTIPSIVGGDRTTRHGIVTAASIPAKKMGIRTADTVASALEKCPQLVTASPDFHFYRECSDNFVRILKGYTNLVEQASIDEAYVDAGDPSDPLEFAGEIRQKIREDLGFTVNVGISTNCLLAKMASDFEKPDRTHTLYPREIGSRMWPLPIGSLYGCGRRTAEKLQRIGIMTIGDAAGASVDVLKSVLGEKSGEYIHLSANGIGRETLKTERDAAKSYSNEITTSFDITRENYTAEMPKLIRMLGRKVAGRLQKAGVYAATVGVMVKTNTFHRHSMQVTLPEAVQDEKTIINASMGLADRLMLGDHGIFARESGIRLVGISASNLDDGSFRQMNLWEYAADLEKKKRNDRLTEMMQEINGKYGEDTIRKGKGLFIKT